MEISPEYSFEELMLKLKLQYFSQLLQRADSLGKTLMLGKIEGRRRRGLQRMRWLDGITEWVRVEQIPGVGEVKSLSRGRLFATPWTVAYQASLSMGSSRQGYWSGLPLPSPGHENEKWKWSRSVVSDSVWLQRRQPTRLPHPWDSPVKNTGVGRHFLLHF